MVHGGVEETVAVYIVLLTVACVTGIVVKKLAHVPYTIALTVVGLVVAFLHIGPEIEETGFSKELVFLVLLPPLLFQGALHLDFSRLRRNSLPVAAFATVGILITMFVIGFLTHWLGAFETFPIALLFGALICTTDPVSVLAIFRENNVPTDLKYLVEGESLFNDGTGVVLFSIVLGVVLGGGEFHLGEGIFEFFKVALGGTVIGLAIGFVTYQVLKKLNDHLLENAICIVCCYASFWLAEHYHLSGVISTVCAGLLLGNQGRALAMNPKTKETVETFFESIDFLINSLLFILIGLELQLIPNDQIIRFAPAVAICIGAVLIGRAIVVYPLFFLTRKAAGNYPMSWAHVLNWGGLRGSIPIALLLGLLTYNKEENLAPHLNALLVCGFGVVCFSLIVQGLTMKPLIALTGVRVPDDGEHGSRHE